MSKVRKLTVSEYNHKAGRYSTRELPCSTTVFLASYNGVVLGSSLHGELSATVESVETALNREHDRTDVFLIEYQKVQKGLLNCGIYSPKDEPGLVFRKITVPNSALYRGVD